MPTPSSELYRRIPLTQGQFALVDVSDYEWLMQWKWFAHWEPTLQSYRAVRQMKLTDNKQTAVYMHREILGLKRGDKRKGDHWNHDTLDNRRSNLRIASNAQNCMNRRKRRDSHQPAKGVEKLPSGRYRAQIFTGGKNIHLGVRNTVEEACKLYAESALKFYGLFHCLG